MDGHCLSPYTCRCCTVSKQFDNFNGLAGKRQNVKISHRQNFPLYGIIIIMIVTSYIFLYKHPDVISSFHSRDGTDVWVWH